MENLEKKKNTQIIILSIIIVLLIGALVYLLFIKKDDKKESLNNKPIDNIQDNNKPNDNIQDNNNSNDNVQDSNKPSDNKDKDIVYKGGTTTLKISNNVYYLDGKKFIVDFKKEDNNYAVYNGHIDGREYGQWGTQILVNKKNNTIEYISTAEGAPDVIKTEAGYFFVKNYEVFGEVYTTNWKKIGYGDNTTQENSFIEKNYKSDKEGIYLYDSAEGFANKDGNLEKYDINGNKIIEIKTFNLTDKNQEIDFNNKKVKLRVVSNDDSSELYFNDKKIATINFDYVKAYIADKVILLEYLGGQCEGYIFGLINENGVYSNFDNKGRNYMNLHIKNGKIYATPFNCTSVGGEIYSKVEFKYNGKTINIVEVK